MRPFDIAIIGTSLTVNVANRNWPQMLAETLQPGKQSLVRVNCMGKSGSTTNWGAANLGPILRMRPQLILCEWLNDGNDNDQAPNLPEAMTLAKSAANWNSIFGQIATGLPGIPVFSMALVRPRTDAPYAALPSYNAQLATITANWGSTFIDCYSAWGDPALHPNEFGAADPIHPLIAGYLRVSIPLIASVIASLIP